MADMQTDLYGSLGAIVDTWQAHIGAAPDDAEAIDAAFRCLLMLDAIERTLRPLEDMARGVLSEAGEKAGGVPDDDPVARWLTYAEEQARSISGHERAQTAALMALAYIVRNNAK